MSTFRAFSSLSLTGFLILFVVAGCASHDNSTPPMPDADDGARTDQQLIASVRDAAVANAILTQHTLYPYHFVPNGKELNELGERDLAVLAGYYRANPGNLNVRKGEVPAELYEGRVRAVQDALARDGVEVARVKVSDKLPSGAGIPSEDVIHILQMNFKETGKGYTDSGEGNSISVGGEQGSSSSSGTGGQSSGGGMR